MKYHLNLFSPETWTNFTASGCRVSGFSRHQETQARRQIEAGDVFLCYLVKLGRWCGALKIVSGPTIDHTPLFRSKDDPFVVRFNVEPLVVLEPTNAIPVGTPEVWTKLSWTRSIEFGSVGWGANFQRSLREMPSEDGEFILKLLKLQAEEKKNYDLTAKDLRALRGASIVRTERGEIAVEIPEPDYEDAASSVDVEAEPGVRDSHAMQAFLAEIGAKMGFRIWLPRADRERVKKAAKSDFSEALIDQLPMNYNEATVRTIEQIDVIWLRGRAIARAFEVEHTTAIYSGLLRMADLIALQPDISIPLHIVAPGAREGAVLEQLRRPVFSLLDSGPLSERCTLILYKDLEALAHTPHLQHMNDSILSEIEISADE